MFVIFPLNILSLQTKEENNNGAKTEKPGSVPIDDPNAPDYWRTGLDDIEKAIAGVKKGKVEIVCLSAGGRPVYQIFYGEPNDVKNQANVSSAMAVATRVLPAGTTNNLVYYADKSSKDYRPTLYLVGAIHATEVEGTAALMNLISILETGKDLRGVEFPLITQSAEKMNFIINLCANPDGRARFPYHSVVGLHPDISNYYTMGTWKGGELSSYPLNKSVHPMLPALKEGDFLGCYYNDDGINLMHDFFFTNPSNETKALLQTAEKHAPDFTVLFHSGGNNIFHTAGSGYLVIPAKTKIRSFVSALRARYQTKGFEFGSSNGTDGINDSDTGFFNLTSALTHVTGEPCITFESNSSSDAPGTRYTHEQIYNQHMMLFEELCKFVLKY